MNQTEPGQNVENGEITIFELFGAMKSLGRYLKSKTLLILVFAILGGILGVGYAIITKKTYTALCTFVLEDAKQGGVMGQYGGLAAIAGINLGGGGGGIFEGDNILELYKSRTMIEKSLLSVCNFNGKKRLLIDRFIDSYDLRSEQLNDGKIPALNFNGDPEKFNRYQDSLVTVFADLINKKILAVSKPDKKLNIINVEVTSVDELFSKYFTEKLVQNVNEFYVQTKSKKSLINVQILQHQADSVKSLLNSSIFGVASAIDAAPNANPDLTSLRVPSQKKQIEVQANSAIYSEMVKNLELAKISLRQEMPLIQVIDKPVLPLKYNRISKVKAILIGAVLGSFIIIVIIIINVGIKKIMLRVP